MSTKISKLVVFLFFLFFAGIHTQAVDQGEVKEFLNQVNRPVVYRLPGTDKARVRTNITYKKDTTAEFLQMDLYTPPVRKDLIPVVILIHGGVESDDPLRPKARLRTIAPEVWATLLWSALSLRRSVYETEFDLPLSVCVCCADVL